MLVFGALLLVWRLSRRKRRSKTASVNVKPGQSVALRVTRAGADPVTYRIDA